MDQRFILRFEAEQILTWAEHYTDDDTRIEEVIAPAVQRRGYLTRSDLRKICYWKSPRTRRRIDKNDEAFIQVVTQVARTTPNERLRISSLTLLDGISWPTASVILHFCHPEPYPVLDFRALWSLSVDVPKQYDFAFWWAYTGFCRNLANHVEVSMRVLDRALWQYAKENQST